MLSTRTVAYIVIFVIAGMWAQARHRAREREDELRSKAFSDAFALVLRVGLSDDSPRSFDDCGIPPEERMDPWGRPFVLRRVDGIPCVLSPGPDGVEGNADDVVVRPPRYWRFTRGC